MSVARNVAYPLAMRGMPKAEIAIRVRQALDMVELGGLAERLPKQLSGGQQQRVALARATVFQPRLLLLDEPFGALDQFTREELWSILQDLWIAHQPTVLLVTHDLREAGFLGSRVCVMSARPGRILDDQSVSFARPRTVAMTFEPDFVALNQRLREFIVGERTAVAQGAGSHG
jgi:NitT/TauT family transport system ATP-binding protein